MLELNYTFLSEVMTEGVWAECCSAVRQHTPKEPLVRWIASSGQTSTHCGFSE